MDKMNTQMLFMEEVFETRKQKQMKRPRIKDQVFSYLQRCKAGDSFLQGLHQEKKEITEFLKKIREKDEQDTEPAVASDEEAPVAQTEHSKIKTFLRRNKPVSQQSFIS